MGVIKQTPRRAIDPSSGNNSDTEGFNGLSGAGSQSVSTENLRNTYDTSLTDNPDGLVALYNLSLTRRRAAPRVRLPAVPADTTPRHRKNGKGSSRKSRRYESQLMLIQEGDEDNEPSEVTIEDLVPVIQTARTFTRFLNESSMTTLMNSFIDYPDDRLLQQRTEKTEIKPKCSSSTHFDAEIAFYGICRKLRNILKQRHLPLGMVDSLEEGLLGFFCTHPDSTFQSGPLDAYRRGLLHAISQYNNLKSYSIGKIKTEKVVHVQNKSAEFRPPPIRLVSYIESKLHGGEQNKI